MNDELARQLGNGLTSLSNSLLEHQRASARDRGMMLQKLDDMRDDFNEKLDDLSKRIIDVCDRGGEEHNEMRARLAALELRHQTDEARRQGAEQFKQAISGSVKWIGANFANCVIVAYIGFQALVFAFNAIIPQQTVAQQAATRIAVPQ